jgi:hypothetical protein
MSLLSPCGRSAEGAPPRQVTIGAPGAVVPPPAPVDAPASDVGSNGSEAGLERMRFIARSLLARLEAGVDELVVVWTPSICLRSRVELVAALLQSDDAIRDVAVSFGSGVATRSTAMVEWVASGSFSGPAFLHDDVLVEPTGAVVRVPGAIAASFVSGRATRITLYFDRLAVLEQMMYPATAA